MNIMKRIMCAVLTLVMALSLSTAAFAAADTEVNSALKDTAAYLQRTVTSPTVNSVGGEWAVIGLARSNIDVPKSYYDTYYRNLETYVRTHSGELSSNKYTEYSRVILALTAIGKDPHNVAGYDLTAPLGDYNAVLRQGINGPIWALIALDSGRYEMPVNKSAAVRATRQMYIDYILNSEMSGGGWSLTGRDDDPDITGMAIQALAGYTDQSKVKAAVDRGLEKLSAIQNRDGSFSAGSTFSGDGACTESTVQVLVALTAMGIGLDDSRFTQGGNTVLDGLMSFYQAGGGFSHIAGGSINGMSTEQGLYALVAAQRAKDGMNSLYDMTEEKDGSSQPEPGISGSFSDVKTTDWFYSDVAFVVERGLFSGVGSGKFAPRSAMTREMLATVLYRLEGEPKVSGTTTFSDVKAGSWYADAVLWASENKIVAGYSADRFGTGDDVTREQMAAMLMRYADYKGCDTSAAASLAKFADAGKISSYARKAMAWANAEGLVLGTADTIIDPAGNALRCQVAAILHRFCDKVVQ